MKTLGEILKTERLKHHLSLPELAERTKIRREYLTALEDNRFYDLPAAVYVKGFIRAYARQFGFDEQPLLGLLRRDFRESAAGKLVPREFIKPVLKKRVVWTPITWALIVLSTIFVTLFSYVAVQWYNLQKPPRLAVSEPAENAVVTPKLRVKGQTITEGVVTVNLQPVAIQPDGSFEAEVLLPNTGVHAVTVEVVDRRGKKAVVQRSVNVENPK